MLLLSSSKCCKHRYLYYVFLKDIPFYPYIHLWKVNRSLLDFSLFPSSSERSQWFLRYSFSCINFLWEPFVNGVVLLLGFLAHKWCMLDVSRCWWYLVFEQYGHEIWHLNICQCESTSCKPYILMIHLASDKNIWKQ